MASCSVAFLSSSILPKCPSLILISPPAIAGKRTNQRRRFRCCLAVKDDGVASPPAAAGGADLRVVFTGGGSGGHIYPAIAIADDLKTLAPSAAILFVGAPAGMERTAVSSAGYSFSPVSPARLTRPLLSPLNLLLPFHLLGSIFAAWQLLRRFKPHIVVGTGGYVSAPICLAAAFSGIPISIQEQNAIPGVTNRLIAPYASKIFLAFNGCVKYFPKPKCLVYGNPIRLALRKFVEKSAARAHFFPSIGSKVGDEKAQVVLVLGGSQGAFAINIAMLNMYNEMLAEHKNRFVIWQTGVDGFSEMESLVRKHRRLMLTPFLHEMDMAYAAADVVISRAGAMACTEILTTGKPSILIPSPVATDDHQTFNAYIMADVAGSKVLPEDELDSCSLEFAVDEVLGNEKLMAEMSEKALRSARPNASANIAKCILSLVDVSSAKLI